MELSWRTEQVVSPNESHGGAVSFDTIKDIDSLTCGLPLDTLSISPSKQLKHKVLCHLGNRSLVQDKDTLKLVSFLKIALLPFLVSFNRQTGLFRMFWKTARLSAMSRGYHV